MLKKSIGISYLMKKTVKAILLIYGIGVVESGIYIAYNTKQEECGLNSINTGTLLYKVNYMGYCLSNYIISFIHGTVHGLTWPTQVFNHIYQYNPYHHVVKKE